MRLAANKITNILDFFLLWNLCSRFHWGSLNIWKEHKWCWIPMFLPATCFFWSFRAKSRVLICFPWTAENSKSPCQHLPRRYQPVNRNFQLWWRIQSPHCLSQQSLFQFIEMLPTVHKKFISTPTSPAETYDSPLHFNSLQTGAHASSMV